MTAATTDSTEAGAVDVGGRPTIYTEEIASEICDRLVRGEGLAAICRDEHLPDVSTVYRWIWEDHEGFYDRYTRAREQQAELRADEVVSLADEATDAGSAQVAKVRVDARKWVAAKLLPKKYGERMQVESTSLHLHKHELSVDREQLAALSAEDQGRLCDLLLRLTGGSQSGRQQDDTSLPGPGDGEGGGDGE